RFRLAVAWLTEATKAGYSREGNRVFIGSPAHDFEIHVPDVPDNLHPRSWARHDGVSALSPRPVARIAEASSANAHTCYWASVCSRNHRSRGSRGGIHASRQRRLVSGAVDHRGGSVSSRG